MFDFFISLLNFGLVLVMLVAYGERNRALDALYSIRTKNKVIANHVSRAVAHLRGDVARVSSSRLQLDKNAEAAKKEATKQLTEEMHKLLDMDRRMQALKKIQRNLAPKIRKEKPESKEVKKNA